MKTKTCTKCGVEKPLSKFNRRSPPNSSYYCWCKPCHNTANSEWRRNNKEKHRLIQKRWYKANPDKVRDVYLKSHYKITTVDYNAMATSQNFRCLACNEKTTLVIDHDHACCPTEKSCGKCIRGLLCPGCNKALGSVNDSKARLLLLVKYLDRKKEG